MAKAVDGTDETVASELDSVAEPEDHNLNGISASTPLIRKRQGSAISINKSEKEV